MIEVPRHPLRWLLLLTLLVIGIGYGLREPWPSDEPRFVLVAKQMVESGDWLFPHRGQELYPDKPPLYFWALALSYQLIGDWRWSFLLPSLLSALLVIGLTFDLGKRLHDTRAGWWAGLAVLSCLQFAYQFKHAQIDPTLVALTTAALYALCRHLLLGPDRRWLLAGGFFAGLGVITKGVGFLPLLLFVPAVALRAHGWTGLAPADGSGSRSAVWLLVAFLLPIVAWLLPLLWFGWLDGTPERADYLHNILFQQTAQRYAAPSGHHEPFWYFLEVIALFWLPFSLCLPWLWRDWRSAWQRRDARVWLPLLWGLMVLVFFSLSPGKRDMYLLPALPAFALAAAPFLESWLQKPGAQRALQGFTGLLAGLLLVLGVAAWLGQVPAAQALADARGFSAHADRTWGMLMAVGGLGLVALCFWRGPRTHWATGALLLALWSGYGLVVHPLLDAGNSSKALMVEARRLAGPDTPIGLVAWQEQNLLQAVGPTREFGFRAAPPLQLQRAMHWLDQDNADKRLLIGWYNNQPRPAAFACLDLAAVGSQRVAVANRREYWLLSRPAVAHCPRHTP